MPFNGNGVYSAPSLPGSWNPAIAGQSATPSDWNTLLADFVAAFDLQVCRDGQSTISADIPFSTHKITGLGAATAATDAVNASQVTGIITGVADTGAADAYAIAPAVPISAYAAYQRFQFVAANANTTASTLAVSGLSTKAIKRPNGDDLVANDILAGAVCDVEYNGTAFILLSGGSNAISYSLLTARGDLVARGASKPQRVALGANHTVLKSDGTDPAWGAVDLTADVTGILPAANGGTGIAGFTFITNSIAGDVPMDNTANYFTGPTVAQGTSGTWEAFGTVTVRDTGVGPARFYARLTDGTTVIASCVSHSSSAANYPLAISLSGRIASPAGNIRIEVRDIDGTTGLILADYSGNGKDSTLTAIRLA